jgi:hypothetical protein
MKTALGTERCPWCGDDPLYVAYHDEEWGVPCHDERALFEFLILEGAQAGLSWITISGSAKTTAAPTTASIRARSRATAKGRRPPARPMPASCATD